MVSARPTGGGGLARRLNQTMRVGKVRSHRDRLCYSGIAGTSCGVAPLWVCGRSSSARSWSADRPNAPSSSAEKRFECLGGKGNVLMMLAIPGFRSLETMAGIRSFRSLVVLASRTVLRYYPRDVITDHPRLREGREAAR